MEIFHRCITDVQTQSTDGSGLGEIGHFSALESCGHSNRCQEAGSSGLHIALNTGHLAGKGHHGVAQICIIDPNETAELMDIVRHISKEYKITILLIEHDMKFVSGLCDEITVLNFGTVLAQGTPEVALNDPEVIKAYIGG